MKIKLLGTEIYISFLFTAIIAFIIATDRTGLCLPTFFAVLLHETGHLIAMWICDCQPKSIRLVPASISITRDFSSKTNGEIIIALAGPAVNILLFASLFVNYKMTGFPFSADNALINLAVGVFNLLPVKGLDGGTVMFLILNRFLNCQKAEGIIKIITVLFALSFAVLGVTVLINGRDNISILIFAIYLLIGVFIKQ